MQATYLPAYIAFLARTNAYSGVKLALNGVRTIYESRGHTNPLAGCWAIAHQLSGLKRLKPPGTHQKKPITPQMLLWLVEATDPTNTAHVAFTTAALVAFFAFLRKSNVTTGKQRATDEIQPLTAENVWIDFTTYTLWIKLTCTKTIQFGERVLFIPILGIRDHKLDPVWWMRRHLALSGARAPTQTIFAHQPSPRGPWTNLTYRDFTARLKNVLLAKGCDPASYSAHSFRRGGATYAAQCGARPEMIKALGDWRSSAYLVYIATAPGLREEAAQRMRDGILHHGCSEPAGPAQ